MVQHQSQMAYELIVTEKPSAAEKIAFALADTKPVKKRNGQAPYYELEHNKKSIVIACAVGHLYTVTEAEKSKGWAYPIFDLKWEQSSKVNKSSDYTQQYVKAIKDLAKDANEFTVATDYDIEGEVIGLNVILHACKKKDANRMKFSTLTKPDLVKAYANKAKTLDWGQALAGKTRHELDWYYGINLSRALSHAIRSAGQFKVLSSGRVQGPALKILVDKEKEIRDFKPEPYWQLELRTHASNQAGIKVQTVVASEDSEDTVEERDANQIIALHQTEKFSDQLIVNGIFSSIKSEKTTTVGKIKQDQFEQKPPTPFDLTTLQIECHRVHRITPKDTLAIAQELYIDGIISYPRTSSQKLPKELGLKNIIQLLGQQFAYKELTQLLLAQKTLTPNEGEKTDDAHPSIYPTGQQSSKQLSPLQEKVYDLIVRRFLAVFGQNAVRQTMTVQLLVKKEIFITRGTCTITKGWHVFYGPYATFEEVTLPPLKEGDVLPIDALNLLSKFTKPPKRFTAASIIKELEKQGLGTKATRAQIIENLYDRGYVNAKSIEASDLGIRTCETLETYCPKIIDVTLTREFEDEMEEIRQKIKTPEQVLNHSKNVLTEILTEFKSKESIIGKALLAANKETIDQATTIGQCPVCKDGILRILKGKFGSFVGCSRYPDCKTSFALPKGAKIVPNPGVLENGFPTIQLIKARQKPQILSIEGMINASQQKQQMANQTSSDIVREKVAGEGEQCSQCKTGTMKLRKSIYGEFLGCSQYPKCKHIIKIASNTNPTQPKKTA